MDKRVVKRFSGALTVLVALASSETFSLDDQELAKRVGKSASTVVSDRSDAGHLLRHCFSSGEDEDLTFHLDSRSLAKGLAMVTLVAGGARAGEAGLIRTGDALAGVVDDAVRERVARVLDISLGTGPTLPDLDPDTLRVGPLGLEMVYVPGGFFRMGKDEQPRGDMRPEHWVHLSPYLIGKRTVTNREWDAYRARCLRPEEGVPPETRQQRSPDADRPVVFVNRDDIQGFLDFTGLQLPTEAQWEFAAAGPRKNRYPWGDAEPDNRRAVWRRSRDEHAPVASASRASWCGCLDMAGGVWEWTADWYGPYTAHTLWDPRGPDKPTEARCDAVDQRHGRFGVLRGGAFPETEPATLETITRGANYTSHRAKWDGFRVAAPLDWAFLKAHFSVPIDVVGLASQEVVSVVERGYRLEPADLVEARLQGLSGHCTFDVPGGDRYTDGQYTVFDIDGAIRVHRHGDARGTERPWRDEMGVDAHALVVAAAQSSPTGSVCWVDDLAWREELWSNEFRRSEDSLRYSCAAFVRVPGLARFLVVEVHWFDTGLKPHERRERIRWFRRAGWYAPAWLDSLTPS